MAVEKTHLQLGNVNVIAPRTGSTGKRVTLALGIVVFILTLAVHPPSVANAAACASNRDMAALNTRVLQTELMVAALTCGQSASYNSFATQFRQPLTVHGKNLRALFRRAYGGAANKRLNTFVTRLANDASQRSMTLRQGYCAFSARLFDEAIATPQVNFDQLLSKPWIPSRHGFAPCAG